MQFLLFIIFAYLVGSIPFGKLVGKIYGVDIQKKGSGNIGFTNSLRTLGLKPAILVLAADILKGFIPVKIAQLSFPLNDVLIIALITILAHIFPVWLKFKGVKGIATGLGVILAINPLITIVAAIIFLVIFLSTRIVSLSSLVSAWALPFVSYQVAPNLTVFFLLLATIITWTHRENITRLIKGAENRM